MKKKMSILLVLLLLVVLPTFVLAENSKETIIKTTKLNDELTYDELREMLVNDNFGNLEVDKTISEEEFGLVETITVKQPLSKTTYLDNNSSEKIGVYSLASRVDTTTDGAYTATVYVKSTFDKITHNGISYAKIVSSEYKSQIHDGQFRTKYIKGRLGQSGIGAIYANGTYASSTPYSRDFNVNYPVSNKLYKTNSFADRYFSTQYPNNDIGSWAEIRVERLNGGSAFTLRANAYY